MKRNRLILAIGIFGMSVLAGCGNQPVAPTIPAHQQETQIGADAAKKIAQDDAGVIAENAHALLETDDGRFVYEVDFYVDGTEYDYTIDAVSGDVLEKEKEAKMTVPNQVQNTGISIEQAKAIALAHAGVNEADSKFLKTETDYDDGRAVYEVDFSANGIAYDYVIAADSGDILKAEQDKH